MATFTNPTQGITRTEDYRFTVTDLRDFELQQLKEAAKTHNKAVREAVRSGKAVIRTYSNRDDWSMPKVSLMRVHIMPRGPRASSAKKDFDHTTWYSGRYGQYDSYLPQKHATHFDVYYRVDTHADSKLALEMETGLTPGQQAKVDSAMYDQMMFESAMNQELRAAGIVWSYENGRKVYISKEKQIQNLRAAGVSEAAIERMA